MYIVLLRTVEVLPKFGTYFLKNQDVVGGTYLVRLKKKCIRLAKMFVWVFPNILASPIKLIKQKAKRRCL